MAWQDVKCVMSKLQHTWQGAHGAVRHTPILMILAMLHALFSINKRLIRTYSTTVEEYLHYYRKTGNRPRCLCDAYGGSSGMSVNSILPFLGTLANSCCCVFRGLCAARQTDIQTRAMGRHFPALSAFLRRSYVRR